MCVLLFYWHPQLMDLIFIAALVQGGSKKIFFIQSCVLQFFFHIFQVVLTADLRDSFVTNMDPTGLFTTQQPTKMIEAYFAAKSILLPQRQCRRDFGRNNVPYRRTIQSFLAKFRETQSVVDAPQGPQQSKSFKSFKSNKPGSFSIL